MSCFPNNTSPCTAGKSERARLCSESNSVHRTPPRSHIVRVARQLAYSSLSLSLSFPFSPLPFFPAKSLSRHYSPRHYHRLFGRLRSSIRIMPTLLPLFTTYETSRKRRSRGLSSPSILAALYCAAQCLL